MPAVWTTPATWDVDQLVTNDDLNEQVRDNLEYLLSPNHDQIVRDNSGDYTITNVGTFQDIDTTNLSIHFHNPIVITGNGISKSGGVRMIRCNEDILWIGSCLLIVHYLACEV